MTHSDFMTETKFEQSISPTLKKTNHGQPSSKAS
jgi:hypothetical protein